MGDGTHISWTDATWNPITGCMIKSPGCEGCYAMTLAGTRLRQHPSRSGLTRMVKGRPIWTGDVRFNPQWLDQPLRWRDPRDIFVVAHGDLFYEKVPDEWIDMVFAVMATSTQHRFQVLTKRPDRALAYLRRLEAGSVGAVERYIASEWYRTGALARASLDPPMSEPTPPTAQVRHLYDLAVPQMVSQGIRRDPNYSTGCNIGERHWQKWPLHNVLIGVSVERQKEADERREQLADIAALGWRTWVSYEPALRSVDWSGWEFIRWMVSGGESGTNARPSHPDWHRAARDFCVARDISYHFKQWGEWVPESQTSIDLAMHNFRELTIGAPTRDGCVFCVGKKAAGATLDGREWREMLR